MTKHDEYVDDLVRKIRGDYLAITTHLDYGCSERHYGEIDVVGFGEGFIDFYEVKCSKHYGKVQKAIHQLQRARAVIGYEGTNYLYTPRHGIENIEDLVEESKKKPKRGR